MCGIVGFIQCGSIDQLQDAVDIISHRGPDDDGIRWFDELGSGLGHRRLSIIDLSELGHQPMVHQEKGRWIVFNGEIFNFADIRKDLLAEGYSFISDSDTEVILKAYDCWGAKCLDRMNGMFAFAILEEESGKVFAARDRLGIKPFYYYHEGRSLVFGSEIKSILKCKDVETEPDMFALHTPIHYQIGERTGFRNILKLPPGCYIDFDAGGLKITPYWTITPSEQAMPEKEAVERLEELLLDSVRLQMIADVQVGALLSGGLDSSIVCAMMQQRTDKPITTFTIRFKDKDLKQQGNVNDAVYAQRLVDEFGFQHHEITIEPDIVDLLPKMIWHLDEPIADPAAINTYLISKAARDQGIVVLLSGMGGDEVFGGYRGQLACLKAEQYQKMLPGMVRKPMESLIRRLPETTRNRSLKYVRWVKRFTEFASLPPFERYISSTNSSLQAADFVNYFVDAPLLEESYYYQLEKESFFEHDISYLGRICLNDTKFYLSNHNLTYTDKSAMAAGVETRPPLIDHRIVELMFNLPPEYRIKGNVQKYLLKEVSTKYIPDWVIKRPKAPFSAPMRGWLKNDLREMVGDILSPDTLRKRGIYNADFVQQLIRQNDKGLKDNSQLIWRLMINELWFRTYFDK